MSTSQTTDQTIRRSKLDTSLLASRAALVRLRVGTWTERRRDSDVESEVARSKRSDTRRVTVTKTLFAPESLARITEASRNLRERHRSMTLPWDDGGLRLIPIQKVEEYRGEMDRLLAEREAAVNEFCDNFDELMEAQRERLGDLFRESDYATPEAVRQAYGASYTFSEISGGGANSFLYADIDDVVRARLRADIENEVKDRIGDSVKSLAERLVETMRALSGQLVEGGRVHTGTVERLQDVLRHASDLNITDDPLIETAILRAKDAIDGVRADELRPAAKGFDEDKRAEVQSALASASDRLAGFMGPAC